MPLVYDPTGVAPANYIQDEAHPLIVGPRVPTNEGPFYRTGFEVEGTQIDGGTASGNVTINNYTIPVTAVTDTIHPGMAISGTGIPADTIVTSVTLTSGVASSVQISNAPTATNNGVTLTFGGVTKPLVEGVDFLMSPLFATVAANTGKEAYSYILLMNYETWDTISLTYHGVGGDPDIVLAAQIVQAGEFDQTDLVTWLAFTGELASLPLTGGKTDLKNTGVVYLLASKLDAIAKSMRTPQAFMAFITDSFTPLQTLVTALQAQVNSLQTALNNNGLLTASSVSQAYVDAGDAEASGTLTWGAGNNSGSFVSPTGLVDNWGKTTVNAGASVNVVFGQAHLKGPFFFPWYNANLAITNLTLTGFTVTNSSGGALTLHWLSRG